MALFPKRLFAQFVLLLSMILVATIVSYGWVASRKQVTITREVIRTNAAVVARSLAESSAHYLIIQDYAGLGAFLVRVAELPNVKGITVCEPDGMVVAEAVRQGDRAVEITKPRIEVMPASPGPGISEQGEELLIWHPVATYNLIGWVRLSYGLEAVNELRRTIWTYTVLLLSACVPLGVLLLSLVVRRPVSEIGRLSAFARRLSTVKGEQISGKCPSEELSVLQSSLNTASRELNDREQQLIAEREELRLNEERFEALYQLNRMAGDQEDAIADFALEAGVRLTRSTGGYLHFFNEDEETISLYRWSKEVIKFCTATYDSHYPLASAGVWADSVRSGKPVIHNDFAALEGKKGYPDGHFPVLRHMGVPVFESGRIVAVAGVGNKEQPYNESDVRQLQLLMNEMWQLFKHKRAELEMRDLQAQLLQSQKMEAVGRLAGGIAHDFNNMLAVILGYAEMNKDELKDGDPLLHNLRMIEKAAEHSRDITRQLLAFSRKQISEPKVIDLNDSLAQMEKTFARLIGEDIELHFYPGKDLWKIKIDPAQVDQILMNLAVNARDAMPKGGRLTVQTRNVQLDKTYARGHFGIESGEYVLLEVSDEGAGMDKETVSHIFEPFFTTKETGKGTGLGLATVYGIVHQNQGFINVYSEPGRGTAFKIYLPRVEKGHEVQAVPEAGPAYEGSGTILLVEDDAMVREMAAAMLAKIGFTVLKSETPSEALSLSENRDISIDLLLTDVVMPGMSGKELYERIEAVRHGTKVLFMSGYASEVIAHSGIIEEGMHFIQKPFNEKQLIQKIRETLSSDSESGNLSQGKEHA